MPEKCHIFILPVLVHFHAVADRGDIHRDQEGATRPEDAEPSPRLDYRPREEGGHRTEAPSPGGPERGAL